MKLKNQDATTVSIGYQGDITTIGDLSSVDITTTGNANLPQIYTDAIDNTAGDGNAKLTFGATGLVASRNIATGNVFAINQIDTSNNDGLLELQVNGVAKATFNPNCAAASTPYVFDSANALTGNIVEFKNQGNTLVRINYLGGVVATSRFLTNTGLSNATSSSYAYVNVDSSGTIISRDVADANDALTVNLVNAGSTGNILDLQAAGVTLVNVRKDGITDIKNDINLFQNADDTDSQALELRKSRGTFASPTVITSGDYLGEIVGYGHDGTDYVRSASIRFKSAGIVGANQIASQIEFYTSTDTSPSVETLVGSINQAGVFQVTSIGETGTRIADGFFTDLAVTNTITGSINGNAATVTNGVYTTDVGTVTAKMLQNIATDLGATDINVNLSNSNGSYVTNLTIDGSLTSGKHLITSSVEQGGTGEEFDTLFFAGDSSADHTEAALYGTSNTSRDFMSIFGGEDSSGQFGKGFILLHDKTTPAMKWYHSTSGKYDGTETLLWTLESDGDATFAKDVAVTGNLSAVDVNTSGNINLDEDQYIYFKGDFYYRWFDSNVRSVVWGSCWRTSCRISYLARGHLAVHLPHHKE